MALIDELMTLVCDRRTVMAVSAAVAAVPAFGRSTNVAGGFDFLHGRWDVIHRKLRQRLVGSDDWYEFPGTLEVDPILGGLGNFDRNVLDDPAGRYEASSLRLHSPSDGNWSIWWFDGRSTGVVDPPVIGGFAGGAMGQFFADDRFADRPIRVRTTYRPVGPTTAQWTQAFSPDAGKTWEVNWIMDFRRAA